MSQKIRIIDSLSFDSFHEMFNSGVLFMAALVGGEMEVRCADSARARWMELLRQHRPEFDPRRVHFKPLNVVRRDDALGSLARIFVAGLVGFWQYLAAPRNRQLIYNNNNPCSLWWIWLFNLVLHKRVAIFCHGELELLYQKPRAWKPSFWFKHVYRIFFRYFRIGRHMTFFVLGGSLERNMRHFLSKHNLGQIRSIDHPYFFTEHKGEHTVGSPLRIGTVGAIRRENGLQSLLHLSSRLSGLNVQLAVTGKFNWYIDKPLYPNLEIMSPKGAFVPRQEYEARIAALDYILFLYPSYSYKLTASGAIFDALSMNKPVIALENDYFKETLKLPIGHMVRSENEIFRTIERLASGQSDDYAAFLKNIEELKKLYSPEHIAADFAEKLK